MNFFAPVLDRIKKQSPSYDMERIVRAYEYARDAHEGQKRFSGEPYIIHPVAVVDILLDYNPDEEMIIAALLHDVSEDTDRTLVQIEAEFGPKVAYMVQGLEKLSKVRSRIDEPYAENLRRMFVHMAADFRIIIIKLCDRLHNMSTLEYVKPHKQERIATETLDVYVPIAARLGIYNLKSKLEDLCFEFLEPEHYENVKEQLSSYSRMTDPLILDIKKTLTKCLAGGGFKKFKVEARLKSLYSIHVKLSRKSLSSVDEIYDIFAMRIILQDQKKDGREYTGHLYEALGVIHGMWAPLQQRFKDYIAVPKPNGYRSLHTTVVGLGPKSRNQPTEIQIRTESMHGEAERGVASHWLYGETGGATAGMDAEEIRNSSKFGERLGWVKALNSLQEEVSNNEEFIDDLHRDIFHRRIFVLTPAGDVQDLPAGATPIDFAYAVHSEVGNHCAMAKVNDAIVPLDYELQNGNVVEIITRDNAEPNQYWLSFVKTSSAKSKIKGWFRSNADPQKILREGLEILNKHLEQISKAPLDADLQLLKNYGGCKLTLKDREELLRDIGRGMLYPNVVIKTLFPAEELLRSRSRIIEIKKKKQDKKKAIEEVGKNEVVVDGYTDFPIKMATCCQPNPGDAIIGYITRGRGVTVHKKACKVINNRKTERLIAAHWRKDVAAPTYRVSLEVVMQDRIGLLSDISCLTSQMGINITKMALNEATNSTFIFSEFEVAIKDYDQLARLIQKIQEVPNVKSVKKLD